MTRYSLRILLTVALFCGVVTTLPAATPVDDAIAEGVRREAFKIDLANKLKEARASQTKGHYLDAATEFQQCFELVNKIVTGVDAERQEVVAGLANARLQLAYQAQRRGDLLAAEQQVDAVLKIDKENPTALTYKSSIDKALKKQAGFRPSQETLNEMPDIQKTNIIASTLVQDAKLLYEAGQLEKATDKLKEAIRLDPNNRAAFYYLDLVIEKKFSNESTLRESLSKKMMLDVVEAWNDPIKGPKLASPNPIAHTNFVHTGPGRHVIYDKLNRIKMQEVSWDGIPLGEVVKMLSEESKKRDPDRVGVNFMISSFLDPVAPPIQGNDPDTGLPLPVPVNEPLSLEGTIIRVVPPLNNLTMAQTLDAIVKVADRPIKFSVEEYAVVFSLKQQEIQPLYNRWYKIDPNTFMQGMQGVQAFDFGATSTGGSGSSSGGGGRSGGGGGSSRGGGGGGGSFGGGGGQNGQGGGNNGSEYVGVSLAGSSRRGQLGGGGLNQGAGNNATGNGPGQGGVRFLTQETQTQTVIDTARQFFIAAGVDLSPPKALFFNDRLGMLMVRATMQELDIVEEAMQVLNMTPPQITIESKFTEISQDDSRALGFDWFIGNTLINNGKIGVQGGTAPSYGYNPLDPLNSPAASPANPSGVFPGPFFGPGFLPPSANDNFLTSGLRNSAPALATVTGILTDPQFRVVIRALENREGVDLISAPKVTTLSSRQTQIKIVNIRYIVVDLDLGQTSSGGFTGGAVAGVGGAGGGAVGSTIQPIAEPFELGPILDVVPYVSADGYTIQMTIIPTIKEFVGYDLESAQLFSAQAQSVGGAGAANPLTTTTPLPIFRLRQVVTSAVIWDGQTVVLGGLITETVNKIKDKVPILGDLPIAGRFFRSESNMTSKKNLVIFVTPTIIDPAGNRVHSEETLPFAQNQFPAQTSVSSVTP